MPRMPSDLVLSRTAELFSALANEARLRALVALDRMGPLAVSDLLPLCGLEQTALSHQLRILRTAGLVSAERQGKSVVYALADAHVSAILDGGLVHAGERRSDRRSR
jgi:DNA-binding transcriptional ArsR family regulator